MSKKKQQKLTISQKRELEEWEKKIESGEAYKIAEDEIKYNIKADFDCEKLLDRFSKTLLPKLKYGTGEPTDEEYKDFYSLSISYGMDNGFSILEAIDVGYRGLIQNLRKELIKEYQCESYGEKALVDLAISAYARNLSYSKKFLCLKDPEFLSNERNGFLSVLSKEIDRANRHFITALETLRQFKQPELKLNVKTKTAFIAQEQQFNANQNKQNKNNEAE